jgi:hypothetical protein
MADGRSGEGEGSLGAKALLALSVHLLALGSDPEYPRIVQVQTHPGPG